MDLDVIDATAEALPLELLNPTNKELTAQLSHCEQKLNNVGQSIQDQRKRLQFMTEHLSNVRAEILHTQSLAESKKREVESQDHMLRLIDRECGRLRQKASQLTAAGANWSDQMNLLQNRIFEGNLKVEQLKEALAVNQEELEQWDIARRQKEEDEMAVAQYTKQDEDKIRQLTQTVGKWNEVVRDKRRQLAEEVTATTQVQMDLDRCATAYRRLQNDRGSIMDEWEQVIHAISERDTAIRLAAEQYADGMVWLESRTSMKKNQSDTLDAVTEEKNIINAAIKEKEQAAEKNRNALTLITAQVEELEDEVRLIRDNLSSATRDRNNALSRLENAKNNLVKRKAQEEQFMNRRDEALQNLKAETEAENDMQKQTALIAKLLKEAQSSDKNLDKDVEQLKKEMFRVRQELSNVRAKEQEYVSEIAGAQAQGRNMTEKIAHLDSDSFSQQEVLYNIEFNVQQMEKKVNRAKGERTDEERKELTDKIDLLQKTLEELEQQKRILDVQVKRVREELRQSKNTIEKLDVQKKRAQERVLELNLECDSCKNDSTRIEKELEDELIKVDTMELQLNRLKKRLHNRSEELFGLEERRRQLASDVAEREAEIAVHHELLRMEAKLAEEERRKLINDLLFRQKDLSAIKNRHQVLVGAMNPEESRLSQAQLVVAAAKERETLQHRGDSLDSSIRKLEKEMNKLERIVAILKADNNIFKHKFDKVTENDEEFRTKTILKEKQKDLEKLMNNRTVESNNYQAMIQSKTTELAQLKLEIEQRQNTCVELEKQYNATGQEILQLREAVARYDQAARRAQNSLDETTKNDIEVLESKDRIKVVTNRLLELAQQSGNEFYQQTRELLTQYNLPM